MTKAKFIEDVTKGMQSMRASSRLGQAELGKKLETSRQTVSNIECGKYVPSVEMIWEWAKMTGHEVEITFKAK